MILNVIKIFLPTALAFAFGILITPRLTDFLYKHKMWKKTARNDAADITNNDFKQIHNKEEELSTPRLGGIVIWGSVILAISTMWLMSRVFPSDLSMKLDFFSRNQTLIPLAALLLGSFIGLIDDLLQVTDGAKAYANDSISYRKTKILTVILIGALLGSWFYFKLGVTSIAIPFSENVLHLGWLFVPFFIFVLLATFSTSVIDGIDGLAGGVLAIIFGAYAAIAFGKGQIDIAALCGVVSGSILAFLWFNIPPARFYMGETGILGLLVLLTVVAFLTDTVLLLPLIALPLAATSVSVVLQICSYKYFGKRRVFKVAPLHHHFRALGWPLYKVVMRYWVVSVICAIMGIVIAFVS